MISDPRGLPLDVAPAEEALVQPVLALWVTVNSPVKNFALLQVYVTKYTLEMKKGDQRPVVKIQEGINSCLELIEQC